MADSDKRKAYRAAWNRAYRVKNREKMRAYDREQYERHRDKKRVGKKDYYLKNRDKIIEYHLRYNKIHRNKTRVAAANRRDVNKISLPMLQAIYESNIKKYGTLTCYLCERPIGMGQDVLEHKTPLSRGGKNTLENLGLAHHSCNSAKRNKTYEEYMLFKKQGGECG